MGVNLRKRKLHDGAEQYYFDVYHKGRREFPTLKANLDLILRPGKDKTTLKANAAVVKEAERMVKVLVGEIESGTYRFQAKSKPTASEEDKPTSFLEFFRAEAKARHARRGCKSNTYSCFKHFERFVRIQYGEDLTFQQFTEQAVSGFFAYLQKLVAINEAKSKGKIQLTPDGKINRGINSNCALIYFKRLKMLSLKAFKAGLLPADMASPVKNFRYKEPERHFLLPDEVKILVEDLRRNPTDSLMKRAFLFGCVTGLRWGDLTALTWKNIQGNMLDTEIRKSSKRQHFELDPFALEMVGESKELDDKIFPLSYSIFLNTKLDRWILANGINKKITWHCARHTFASFLYFQTGNIYLVQKALNHSKPEQTQIYARMFDETLNKATANISKLFT